MEDGGGGGGGLWTVNQAHRQALALCLQGIVTVGVGQ